MQAYLDGIIEQFRPITNEGKVASYIPELEKTDNNLLGITLIDTKGMIYESGDTKHQFTIQSISKPIVLLLALIDNGEEKVFEKVGKEPTGDPFNSIVRLETFDEHKPLNPMINAGAISVTALIKGESKEEKIQRILNFIKKITHNQNIKINEDVYQSESKTGYRNRSMAYFLKDFGNIEGDVDEVLEVYFKQCSIEVTTRDLAYIGALLARDGVDILTGERVFSARYSSIVKSYMATCGMYDGSGEFAINVGFPAKSGVGGGIMCTVLGQMGIGVFGPALNKKGNSIAGLKLLESLSKKLELSIY
ncbi:glutaminase A [Fusibacter bizertensis]|uniref:Glutaminase n=1 Tax=Fusibacter bizertensis TaxID=1488331 RepID=A0ABT6NFI7_9FIRM|nr:glutaminase A [Fusibacter bizertensis]MDH8679138.1 glutaminase A [Fusibacter bizertensis]